MKTRPFALIGIDTDPSVEKLKGIIAKNGITWRNTWANPEDEKSLPSLWSVHAYPTVMLIDAKGVIRNKYAGVDEAELMKQIEDLVAETEKAATPRK